MSSPKTPLTRMPDQIDYLSFGNQKIEFSRFYRHRSDAPSLILLHEGLGSIAMWRDFPAQLAIKTKAEVIVYSRYGHGSSSPGAQAYDVSYMHHEAHEVLPRLLGTWKTKFPILVGHSDGASIALIQAAAENSPVAGLIAIAPHIMVEPVSIRAIKLLRQRLYESNLLGKLKRYHNDPSHVFFRWSDIWLQPNFVHWDIRQLLPKIKCPILAMQGQDDPYGTMEQIDGIFNMATGHVTLLKLAKCGHSPHRDKSSESLKAIITFIKSLETE